MARRRSVRGTTSVMRAWRNAERGSARARAAIAAYVAAWLAVTAILVAGLLLLLDDDEPVLEAIRSASGGEFAAMLEITDHAPVELREPVRGLLWITGRLRVPEPDIARRIALQVADVRPHADLLRLGHGATLVRLDPGSAVLSDAEGTAALTPVDLAAAWPDPFCRYEGHWLVHLEESHPDVLDVLARHLPPALRDLRDARLRPLGMDRYGLRLRLEAPGRDHDVRIAWAEQATTVEELRTQMQHLIGCPMRRGVDVDPLGGSRPAS